MGGYHNERCNRYGVTRKLELQATRLTLVGKQAMSRGQHDMFQFVS
jgi:hypothetical protein